MYRPSIKFCVIFVRVCVFLIFASLAAWVLSPAFTDTLITTLVLGGGVFLAVMGAWHDGHALGEKKGRESGNVLFIILIAVVLFASLTAVMNQGSRTSTGMLTDQQARLYATEIIAYGDSIRQAVQKMQMRGISEVDFSFENNVFTLNDGTLLSPPESFPNCSQNSCKIYHPEGGGISARYPPPESVGAGSANSTGWKAGACREDAISVDGIGTEERELAYRCSWLKKEVCLKINDILGVENLDREPPAYTGIAARRYLPEGKFRVPEGDYSGGVVMGKTSYCYRVTNTSEGNYTYLTTLIIR